MEIFMHEQNTVLTSSVKKVRTASGDYLVSINHSTQDSVQRFYEK